MKTMWKNLRMWPTWWTLPLIAVFCYFLPEIISFIDPTGASIHQDFWQHVVIAAFVTMLFSDLSFAFILFNFPNLFKWYQDSFDQTAPPNAWLQFFLFYSAILLSMVLTLVAIV